jgi:hypothetical protein
MKISYFPGIKHNAGKMLEQPTSLRRLFFDRGTDITPSDAPNGMTNGVSVDFVSLDKTSTSVNFTNAPSTVSALTSNVRKAKNLQTASNGTSIPYTNSSAPSSSSANSSSSSFDIHQHPLRLLFSILLAAVACTVIHI